MKRLNEKDFIPAKDTIDILPGEMLATIRKLQGLTQEALSELTGISQSNLSAMEREKQQIGRDRAVLLAQALKIHPAVIMFPNYQVGYAA